MLRTRCADLDGWPSEILSVSHRLRLAGTRRERVATVVQVAEQVLEVALQARAVVPLEHPQLVDLALEQRALLLQLAERPLGRLLGLTHDAVRLALGLA